MTPRRIGAAAVGLVLLVVLVVSDIPLGRVVVDGTLNGSVIALVALGIAVVYKSTGVLNFAQGELGTLPAFLVLLVMMGFDLNGTVDPEAISGWDMLGYLLLAVAIGIVLGVAINGLVIRRLVDASPVISLVATAAVFFLMVGFEAVVFLPQVRTFPRFLEGAPCLESEAGECIRQFQLFGSLVLWHAIVVVAVLAVVVVLLTLLFRTQVGVALLAASQEPFAASLSGVSPRAMSMLAWGIAGGLGGLAGVLGAGVFQQLFPGMVTRDLLVLAFTAAVLGGINSMPGAVVGSILLGVTSSLTNEAALTFDVTGWIPNPPMAAAFAVLLIVMVVRPRGLLGREA
ncbi:MAG: branched-chain amino acid ABC transporter permease [Nitriliruptorales bacterium]|nr:branched-chain amino acid ABC transporter permease [Nitriliruptorales bacterium]